MRLVFVGDFEPACGCSEIMAQYIKAGLVRGIDVATSGYVHESLRGELGYVEDPTGDNFDRVFYVFEDINYLDPKKYPERVEKNLKNFRRDQRIIIDADAKLNPLVSCNNDQNHGNEQEHSSWIETYKLLSDRVLMPCLEQNSRVTPFSFFGYSGYVGKKRKEKGILYIGNNWARWDEFKLFLDSLSDETIQHVGGIQVRGKWWDGSANDSKRTYSDPEYLESRGVEIGPQVPFNEMLEGLSKGKFSPIFVRPVISRQRLITPRMYETISADTFPIFFDSFGYCDEVYGEEASMFQANGKTLNGLLEDISVNPSKYDSALNVIRSRMAANHSYSKRLTDLIGLVF